MLELKFSGNSWPNDFSANRWSGMSQGVAINRIELVCGRLRQNPYAMPMQTTQCGNVHSMTIFTEHKQKGI